MKKFIASIDFAVLLIFLGVILGMMLLGCSGTYRGMKQDVHELSNPQWR